MGILDYSSSENVIVREPDQHRKGAIIIDDGDKVILEEPPLGDVCDSPSENSVTSKFPAINSPYQYLFVPITSNYQTSSPPRHYPTPSFHHQAHSQPRSLSNQVTSASYHNPVYANLYPMAQSTYDYHTNQYHHFYPPTYSWNPSWNHPKKAWSSAYFNQEPSSSSSSSPLSSLPLPSQPKPNDKPNSLDDLTTSASESQSTYYLPWNPWTDSSSYTYHPLPQ